MEKKVILVLQTISILFPKE